MTTDLYLYDSQTRTKKIFCPINRDNIRLYLCGPTVYDDAHIGNARPVIIFDILVRILRYIYPKVTYIRNITDIDDKINLKSARTGKKITEITNIIYQDYIQNMTELNALKPDFEPRATDHVNDMINMCLRLLENKYAYISQGHVLFSVKQFQQYGKLSGIRTKDMRTGVRIDIAPYKKAPEDFILWKPSLHNTPGWNSPWGFGRPGWHIECSAMSTRYLGQDFDIHGGGCDLIFPHHENEIAQSICSNIGSTYARFWLHNGHIMIDGQKMSKSLGNITTINKLLEKWHGEVIRLAIMNTHYHKPLHWTNKILVQAQEMIDYFYNALLNASIIENIMIEPPQCILNALYDNLNTPLAISKIYILVTNLNTAKKHQKAYAKARVLAAAKLLGLLEVDPTRWFQGQGRKIYNQDEVLKIENLIKTRFEAKKNNNFYKADKIRAELQKLNIILEDKESNTIWKYKK